eukprot:tig00021612_g22879.t1
MQQNTAIIRIGQYKLGKTLGIGSFGKVKLAEHELTGQKVAVKIMNRKKIKSLDMDEKVRREIKILRLFMHPHIIRLYEVIDTPTHIFVVMEYVSGGELFDYIVQKGRLSEDEARRFFQQIISGVEYCHKHNVVHRDLKPENLLLDSNYNVKIADFGLSNVMRDGFFLKTSCGSPNYAAPEVISGKLYAGPEVDVWSCGVILYALLCGSLPFDDENIPNLFKKIKGGIYTLPSHLSDLARDLIPKMLIVDPVKRVSIGEIRQHPWFQIKLPAYLAITPEQRMQQTQLIDEDVISDVVAKVGYARELVAEAVRNGDRNQYTVAYYLVSEQKRAEREKAGLPPVQAVEDSMEIENSQPATWPGFDEAAAAMAARTGPSGASLMAPPFAAGPPRSPARPGDVEMADGPPLGGNMDDILGLNPTGHGAGLLAGALGAGALALAKEHSPLPPRKWVLGIQSREPPARVMADLYRALKALNFEWKTISPYQVKARRIDPSAAVAAAAAASTAAVAAPSGSGGAPGGPAASALSAAIAASTAAQQQGAVPMETLTAMTASMLAEKKDGQGTAAAASAAAAAAEASQAADHLRKSMKIMVQLYKVHDTRYLLDIQKMYGGTFPFLDFCSKLIGELRVVQ